MNYYIYEIKNLITNETYIGKRHCSCEPEKDRYFGSGVLLKKYHFNKDGHIRYGSSIEKYGKENFIKTIVKKDINSIKELNYWEEYYIAQYKSKGKAEYNLAKGGEGGDVYIGLDSELREIMVSKARKKAKKTRNTLQSKLKKAKKIIRSFNDTELTKGYFTYPTLEKIRKNKKIFNLLTSEEQEKLMKRLKFFKTNFTKSSNYKRQKYVIRDGKTYDIETLEYRNYVASAISKKNKGKTPWHKGRINVYTDEVKKAMGVKNKGRDISAQCGKKISEVLQNRKMNYSKEWYNNVKQNNQSKEFLEKNKIKRKEYKKHKIGNKNIIICIETNEIFNSEKKAMQKYGPGKIRSVCLGKRKSACQGLHWRFGTEEEVFNAREQLCQKKYQAYLKHLQKQ
jgi:hypothetical protein